MFVKWERAVWHREEKSIPLSSPQQIWEWRNLDSLDKIQTGIKTWSFSFELNAATSVSEVLMTSTRLCSERQNDKEEKDSWNAGFFSEGELQSTVPESNNNKNPTVFVRVINKY